MREHVRSATFYRVRATSILVASVCVAVGLPTISFAGPPSALPLTVASPLPTTEHKHSRFMRIPRMPIARRSPAALQIPRPVATQHPTPVPPAPKLPLSASGGLYITSLPSGADVWIDGAHLGRSPIFFDGIYPGRRIITVTKSGWETRERTVAVIANDVSTESFALERQGPQSGSGCVVLREADDARAYIDGRPVSPSAGSIGETLGRHTVTVVRPRGAFARTFTVLPDPCTVLVLNEAPQHHSVFVQAVDTALPEAHVQVQGKKFVIRYDGKTAVGYLGDASLRLDREAFTVDPPPVLIAGRLYLPVAALSRLSGRSEQALLSRSPSLHDPSIFRSTKLPATGVASPQPGVPGALASPSSQPRPSQGAAPPEDLMVPSAAPSPEASANVPR